jgi:hypothetical protein
MEEARKRIFMVDSRGLITKGRNHISPEKAPFAQEYGHVTECMYLERVLTCMLVV